MATQRPLFAISLIALLGAAVPLLSQTVAPVSAAPKAAPPPPTAAAPKMVPGGMKSLRLVTAVEGIKEFDLDNGLRVLLFPDNSKQTVTVNITYLVGSRHEGYGETGMAHLLEHMLFKGTPTHSNIPQELTSHGARTNASTSYDRTNYFETLSATDENLEWAIGLEADRMVHSKIAKQDLDSEMTVVRNEFEAGENSPQSILIERVMSTAYLWHNYGKSTIGSRADIERVPIERLQAFYRKWYEPDNAVLVVAGKFDEQKVLQLIVGKFGAIPRPERPLEETYTAEPAQDGPREVTLRRVGDTRLAIVGYHIPAGSHPDFAAVNVLSYLLGDEPSGRLYKALVETKKATSVFSFPWQLKEPSMILCEVEVRKESALEPVRDELIKSVEGFAQSPPSDAEVERARQGLLKSWETTMRNSERAALSLSEWSSRGDWRLMFLQRDRIEQVKAADVVRVARAYLTSTNRTEGIFEPTAAADRIEIPATPSVVTLVEKYKGRAALQEGEAFDPAPSAVESRLDRSMIGGVKVTLLPKHTRGATVQVAMSFRFGDESTLKNRSVAAGLAGDMLMRGTTKHSRQEIRDAIDKLKAQLSVNGGVATAAASIETTRENLTAALRLVAEILREPSFPPKEYELLKQEQLASLEDGKSDPNQKAFTAFARHQSPWPAGDPRATMTLDEEIAAIQGTKLEDLVAFYREFYGAQVGEIAVVGDFDKAEISKTLHDLFDGWKSNQPYQRMASKYFDVPATFEKIEAPDKENAIMVAGENFVLQDTDPDYPALVLGNFMMGGGFLNSHLAVRIRQKEGLSYGVGSSFYASSFEKVGSWQANAIYAPQNADKLLAAFKDEVARTLEKGFTPEEVAEAKKGWLQGRQVSRSQDRELVRTLAARSYQGRTLAFDSDLESRVEKLSPDEILAAFKRHLDPNKITIVISGDFAKAKKAEEAARPAAGKAPGAP
jgi:zinc protease